MEMALSWYIYSLVPFFIQLVAAEALFSYRLKRRPLFWVRLGVSLFTSIGVLYLISLAMVACMNGLVIFISLLYVATFMYSVGIMAICFEESFTTLMFAAVAGYTLQNLSYRLLNIMELFGLVWKLSPYIGYWGAYFTLFFTTLIGLGVAAYFIFVRHSNNEDMGKLRSGKVLAISITALAITVFLCTWANAYAWESVDLTLIVYLFSCLSCAFILWLQSGMLQTQRLKQDIAVIKKLWEQDRKQYELSQENIKLINIKCHDLRFRLKTLRTAEGAVSKDELEEIENAITIYDSIVSTGCEPLDTILTETSLFCHENGIKFSCMVDGAKLDFISPSDLYSLFGNIISNALEAVKKVDNEERRLISFRVSQVGEMVLIAAENYFNGEIVVENGAVTTSKEDKLNHGYGLKSIDMLVKKYGGDASICADDDVFRLRILFPVAN